MTGKRVLLLLLLFAAAILEWSLLVYIISKPEGEAGPEVQMLPPSFAFFLSPQDGAIIFQGQTITVEVESPPVEITGAELWVNGHKAQPLPRSMVRYSNRWLVTFLWEATSPATYTFEAILTKATGEREKTPPLTLEVIPPLYLCFASNMAGNYDLYRMRADGTELEPILNSPDDEREISFATDGSIAFVKEGKIWLKGHHGLEFIAQGSEPSFDPKARYLVFRANHNQAQELFIYDLENKTIRQLTSGNSFAGQPSWSPDGEMIAFTAIKDGNWDIYLVRKDGNDLIRLTDHPARDWFPAWSPDGRKIAFVSAMDGSHQIYFINPDGTGLEKVTQIAGGAERPVFSPDGKLMAFVAYTGQGEGFSAREIYILSLSTRWLKRVTSDSFDETDVVWCPPQGKGF